MRWATSGTQLDVGLGSCLVWPHADADRVQARFGAFDLAGNFSGWVEPPPLVLATEAEAVLLMEQQQAELEAEHQARLLESYGYDPRTQGVLTLFNQHLVRPGHLEPLAARVLARLQKYREQADYGESFVVDLEGVQEEAAAARQFVERAEQFAREALSAPP